MKYLLSGLIVCLSVFGFSQAPKLINYQGVARDAIGAPISKATIGLKFEIRQQGASPAVFTETLTVQTDSLGYFATQIGSGQGSNLSLSWQAGVFELMVGMDVAGNGNFVNVGSPKQLASVPYALHAASVPASYANSVLTIGTTSIGLPTSPTPTLVGTGMAAVTPTTGTSFTVNVPQPTLSIASGSISISGGNSVGLPAGLPQGTLTASGQAQVTTAGTNSFNVHVPAQTLALITNSTQLAISGGNTINLPPVYPQAQLNVSGGVASVSSPGTNTFNLLIPPPTLSISNNSLSIVGSNSVLIPIPATPNITGSGLVSVVSTPPNYAVNVPAPSYNGTVLAFGATNVTVAPTLNLSGTILSAGPGSNSVNLSLTGPFKQLTAGTVSLTTVTDNVSLGTSGAPIAKLDVKGTATGSAVINVVNSNPANTMPAVEVATDGGSGLKVTNNSTTGTGGKFVTQNAIAVHAQNTGNSAFALYAENTNNSNASYGAYIGGGLVADSKSTTASYYALRATAQGADRLVVRGDGNVGIGTNGPTEKLEINNGSIKITDGTQGDGKMLVTDASGKGSWKSSPAAISFGGMNINPVIATSAATPLGISSTNSIAFNKVYAGTEIDINLISLMDAGTFSGGATQISFEIYVDGSASAATPTKHFIFASGQKQYVNLRSVFSGLAVGSHTITIIAKTDAGISTNPTVDPGGYGGRLIVKETF